MRRALAALAGGVVGAWFAGWALAALAAWQAEGGMKTNIGAWIALLRRRFNYWTIRESVRKYGVMSPVIIVNGLAIDGNNRIEAARELGIMIPVVRIEGTVELVDPHTLTQTCPIDFSSAGQPDGRSAPPATWANGGAR